MATNRNPRFKTSRRFGLNIYGHSKALKRQPAETRQKKMSEYGLQLTEKQKVKAMYNLLERQFYRYYDKARRMNRYQPARPPRNKTGQPGIPCWLRSFHPSGTPDG